MECDITSYADDNTPYKFDFNLDNLLSNIVKSTNSLLNWFRENHMRANVYQCHLLASSDESSTAKIEYFNIKNSTEEKLLHAFARISHYMELSKRRNLMKASV